MTTAELFNCSTEPQLHECGLWFYGNFKLLSSGKLASIPLATGKDHSPAMRDAIEQQAEKLVLDGKILVTGVNGMAHQRTAVVPLRWGSPRVLALSGGFYHHLGEDLKEEPFRAARLWRYQFDARTDLAVSRRAPWKSPTFASYNPTVDRLIARILKLELTT